MAIPLDPKFLMEKAAPVAVINGRIRKLAKHMQQTMYGQRGVGLAAPQVGEAIRMCVVDARQGATGRLVLINPAIIRFSVETETGLEGCLSHPGKFLPVERAKFLEIEYTSLGGKRKTLRAGGFLGRVIQHEMDHLDGLTIEKTAKKQETTNAKDQS